MPAASLAERLWGENHGFAIYKGKGMGARFVVMAVYASIRIYLPSNIMSILLHRSGVGRKKNMSRLDGILRGSE